MLADIPCELFHGGTVIRRQTTFWDLRPTDANAHFRVHFDQKAEFQFVAQAFDAVILSDDHPLLIDHGEPSEDLLICSAAATPNAILAALGELTAGFFGGWRSLERYLNPDYAAVKILSEGSGMLLRGPSSFVAACRIALGDLHLRLAPRLPCGATRSTQVQSRALVLGKNFVVARDYAFEQIAPPSDV